MSVFLKSCVEVLLRKGSVLAFMNFVYFCSVLVTALIASFLFLPVPFEGWSTEVYGVFLGENLLFLVAGIFLFNLVFCAFVVVTLPSLLFSYKFTCPIKLLVTYGSFLKGAKAGNIILAAVILPLSLLTAFKLTGIILEPQQTETITLEPISWQMEKDLHT